MKPEHFIYKSNDLYYMQNVPKDCYYYYRDERTQTEEFDHKSYNEALERAKAEAVKVDDHYIYQMAMLRYYPNHVDQLKTPKDNFAMYAEQGFVYTINMEDKIEVVCDGRCKGIKCTIGKVCDGDSSHNCLDKVARIAAPKKEEESDYKKHLKYDLEELKSGRNIKIVSRRRLIQYLEETLK